MKDRTCSTRCKWSKGDPKYCKCICKGLNHAKISQTSILEAIEDLKEKDLETLEEFISAKRTKIHNKRVLESWNKDHPEKQVHI